jgi:Putative serine dehydratase domain
MQHLERYEDRKAKLDAAIAQVKEAIEALKKEGLEPELVSGGGTGSYYFESGSGVYNELQCGSYAFMDADYGRVLDKNGKRIDKGEWENALFILTSVMSHAKPDKAICDAGLKAQSVDSGLPFVYGRDDVKYVKCSDEHGVIEDPKGVLKINDKLRLVPGHCDPTCNVHDWYVGNLAGSRSARELTPPALYGYAALDDVLQETSAKKYSTPKQGSYNFDAPNSYDDGRYEPSPPTDASLQYPSALYEHEPQSHPDAAQVHVESSGAWYDEYEEQSHDHSDDHVYGEDYDEDPNPRRRGRFIFVAAVFGLALLGTAGAFAYRAPFADSIVPSLLSIIKAESGPNKIIATSTASQGSVSPQADAADNAGSSERLVSREERPVDVPASVSTASQSVSTAAIISDPAPAAGPDTASEFPLSPLAQSPAARVDSLNRPTLAPAPPIPSANQAATPAAPSPTPAPLKTPGPKKIRTVSIRTDQPNAADSAARQSPSVAVPTTSANEPLSIVPSSNDAESSCRPRLSGLNTTHWPAPRRRTDRAWRGNRHPLHPDQRGAPSAHAHGAAWDIWLVARGTMTALPFRCVVIRPEPRSLRRMRQAMWKQFWLQSACRPAPNAPAEQHAPIPLQPAAGRQT